MSGNPESAMLDPAGVLPEGRISRKFHRLSPFRALVWKEWREQRLIWAALLALSLAVGISARLAPERGQARDLLLLGIPFLWAGMATLLGANAFAGESDTNTESFMGELPVSRQTRFWVKLLVAALLLWCAQALTVLCMPEMDWSGTEPTGPGYFRYYLYFPFALGMLLVSLTSACAASWSGNTLLVFFQTAVAGPCLVLWLALMSRVLYAMTRYLIPSVTAARWFALLTTLFLGYAVLCVGALWLWTARRGGFVRHFRRAAVVLALFVLVPTAPLMAGYVWATLAPSSFLQQWLPPSVVPSPVGRYVLFNYWWPQTTPGWDNNERTVLVDAETSRMVRLTRLRASEISQGVWSPDGARFLFFTSDQWTFPNEISSGFPPWISDTYKEWWVDAATGTRQYVRSFSDLRDRYSYWWDDHTVAFHEGKGLVFQDISTGARRVCADAVRAGVGDYVFQSASASATGIWASIDKTLYCYRPDAAKAAVLKTDLQDREDYYLLAGVSPDGRWALLQAYVPGGQDRVHLCSLETGETSKIRRQYTPSVPGSQTVFARDSKALLVWDDQTVGLCDTATKKVDVLYTLPSYCQFFGPPSLSPSGKYVLVNIRPTRAPTRDRPAVDSQSIVIDTATKRSWTVWEPERVWPPPVQWLGDDHLVMYEASVRWKRAPGWGPVQVPEDYSLWVVSRDGATKRKVLP